jgi:flagellar basal body-associated protein FliL
MDWKSPLLTVCAVVALLLSIAVIVSGRSNQARATALQARQAALSQQQEEINKGNLSQQIGVNLVRAAAEISTRNEKIKELLGRHGFTVTVNPDAAPAR